MNGIMDREHTLVIDISTAQGSVEALQILEEAVGRLTRMPGEKLSIGLDCGGLLLTQRVLEKMMGLLERHHIELESIYARQPQTQQTALGLDLFVKEAPPKAASTNPWQAYLKQTAQQPSQEPALEELQDGRYSIHAGIASTRLPFDMDSLENRKPLQVSQNRTSRHVAKKASRLSGITQLAKDFLNRTQQPKATPWDNDSVFSEAIPVLQSEMPIAKELESIDIGKPLLEEKPSSAPDVSGEVASSAKITVDAANLSDRARPSLPDGAKNLLPKADESVAITQSTFMPPLQFDDQLPTRLFEGPLRSGQAAYSDGHLVVIGDVHGGSELVAKGSIVVWGELRGIAQAGAEGDLKATIRALSIHAIQLRIGSIFARRPDRVDYHKQPTLQELSNTVMPEVAQVVEGEIKIFKDAGGR